MAGATGGGSRLVSPGHRSSERFCILASPGQVVAAVLVDLIDDVREYSSDISLPLAEESSNSVEKVWGGSIEGEKTTAAVR